MEHEPFRPRDVGPRLQPIEVDPRLKPILEQYGHVLVLNHNGEPQPLAQAVDDCKPLVDVLLNAESPDKLKKIIGSQKAPE